MDWIQDFNHFMLNRNNRITVYTYPVQFSCVNDVAESLLMLKRMIPTINFINYYIHNNHLKIIIPI